MASNLNFDMKGKLCVKIPPKIESKEGTLIFIPQPCPGVSVSGDVPGCPHWIEVWIKTTGQPELWKGCGVLMDPHLQVGVAEGVNRAAASVQSTRNEVVRGFEHIVNSLEAKQHFPISPDKESLPLKEALPLLEG